MQKIYIYLSLLLLIQGTFAVGFLNSSSKRGLIYIPNSLFPDDDQIWIQSGSDLTWYYNYQSSPSSIYQNDNSFNFVPMLWGAPASTSDTTFLQNVTAQIMGGSNIQYAMSFNEPDGTSSSGGSNVDPATGAQVWIKNMEPLRKLNVSLGLPAVTGGSSGFTWLSSFLTACNGGCTFDFIPVHWYGNFDGLASHIGQLLELYPGKKIWITEFALDNSPLNDTQSFFETCLQYFDGNANITHYSYFGSFRSFTSNVGVNVAMLTSNGSLTDIGSWYLGGNATGNIPTNQTVVSNITITSSPTKGYTMPPLVTQYSVAGAVSRPAIWNLLPALCLGIILVF